MEQEIEQLSPQDLAESALFIAIVGLAPHSNGAELLILAEAYDKIVGHADPPVEQGYVATESTTMLEVDSNDYLTDRRKRGTIGF